MNIDNSLAHVPQQSPTHEVHSLVPIWILSQYPSFGLPLHLGLSVFIGSVRIRMLLLHWIGSGLQIATVRIVIAVLFLSASDRAPLLGSDRNTPYGAGRAPPARGSPGSDRRLVVHRIVDAAFLQSGRDTKNEWIGSGSSSRLFLVGLAQMVRFGGDDSVRGGDPRSHRAIRSTLNPLSDLNPCTLSSELFTPLDGVFDHSNY